MGRFERPTDVVTRECLDASLRTLPIEDASAILEGPASPHVLSLNAFVGFAIWAFETWGVSSKDRETSLRWLGAVERIRDLGKDPSARTSARAFVRAELESLAKERTGAARLAFVKAICGEALRREAEEAREELSGPAGAAIARVVWTSDTRSDRRPEAWIVELADRRWAAMVYPARGRPKRVWYEGSRDDALSSLPEEWFEEASAAALREAE